MTIQELKDKMKDDAEALKTIEDLEAKINNDYLTDNIALKKENEKLKFNNELLYNQIMNGAGVKEEIKDDNPVFKDYSNEIIKELRKIK